MRKKYSYYLISIASNSCSSCSNTIKLNLRYLAEFQRCGISILVDMEYGVNQIHIGSITGIIKLGKWPSPRKRESK
jgi:hypothetical protein